MRGLFAQVSTIEVQAKIDQRHVTITRAPTYVYGVPFLTSSKSHPTLNAGVSEDICQRQRPLTFTASVVLVCHHLRHGQATSKTTLKQEKKKKMVSISHPSGL
jgi:hypothetical protein